ncbi:MAG: HIT family protein, partial [Thermodesulfobacteriota bacterium]
MVLGLAAALPGDGPRRSPARSDRSVGCGPSGANRPLTGLLVGGDRRRRFPSVSADCIFCGIAAGREPASVVHRDSQVVAFMANAPVNPGHVLVIPRDHAASFTDLAPDRAAALARAAQRAASALRGAELRCEGL